MLKLTESNFWFPETLKIGHKTSMIYLLLRFILKHFISEHFSVLRILGISLVREIQCMITYQLKSQSWFPYDIHFNFICSYETKTVRYFHKPRTYSTTGYTHIHLCTADMTVVRPHICVAKKQQHMLWNSRGSLQVRQVSSQAVISSLAPQQTVLKEEDKSG